MSFQNDKYAVSDEFSAETSGESSRVRFRPNIRFLLAGAWFGVLLVKAEVISWFRIQEMFRLDSFHMYGVIGAAVAVGAVSVWLIRRFNGKTISGEAIRLESRRFDKGKIYGGLIFGIGWAITGACPGPIYAQIGYGYYSGIVTLAAAVAGAWVYGYYRSRLPH